MSQNEFDYYLKGSEEKGIDNWEQTRMLCFYMVITQTGSNRFKKPEDIFSLPWDKKAVKKKMSNEDIKKLSEQIKDIQHGKEKH